MKKKLMSILSLTLAATMCLSACSSGGAAKTDTAVANAAGTAAGGESAAAETEHSVAMILPGLITDEAFNQFTYEGMVDRKSVV